MKKILVGRPIPEAEIGCPCRGNTTCPLNRCCNMETVVYKVKVTAIGSNGQSSMWKYVGAREGSLRTGFNNHKSFFNILERCYATILAKHVWSSKKGTAEYSIKWKMLEKCQLYFNNSRKCRLCLTENRTILKGTQHLDVYLNSRKCSILTHMKGNTSYCTCILRHNCKHRSPASTFH